MDKKIFLYVSLAENAGQRLQSVVSKVVPWENITVIQNIEDLFHRLRQPQNNVVVTIILADNKDLHHFQKNRDLLHRNTVILILPDQDQKTITMGHVLRPRFLTYADGDFSDVRDVLKKMVGRITAFRKDRISLSYTNKPLQKKSTLKGMNLLNQQAPAFGSKLNEPHQFQSYSQAWCLRKSYTIDLSVKFAFP